MWGAERLYASDLNAEIQNIIDNAASLISPLPGSLDWDGYAHTLDAAGATTAQSTATTAWSFTPGSKSGTPGTTGSVSNWAANTYTDSATAGSGTAATWTSHSFQRPTLAATNASVTTTNATTLYVANAPLAGSNETLTNAWSLWVDDGAVRLDGDLHIQADLVGTINKYSLAGSVSGNALTIALKDRDGNDASASTPFTFRFRSATPSTPTATIGSVTGALSTVISSGSTAGTVSGVAHRLHIGALLTGSTVELCWYQGYSTTTGLKVFSPSELITTTAEGGAGGADSAEVMYSTTARTGVPWVYLGYIESTQGTAGTWATSPSKIHTASDSSPLPGAILSRHYTATGAVATGTTVIPVDDTIPQVGEGDQYMSLAVTPSSTINVLVIRHSGNYATSAGTILAVTLHQDGAADASAVAPDIIGADPRPIDLTHQQRAGTTSASTFTIRAGPTAGTLTFNGSGGARRYGGKLSSYLEIQEIFA